MSVQDMFDGKLSPEVQRRFDTLRDFMADKGNYICNQCGSEMEVASGCVICPKCGSKDCGAE